MGNSHLKSPAGTLAFGLELLLSALSLVSVLPRMLVERQCWGRIEMSPKETQRPCCVRQEGLWAPALLCLLSGPGMGGDSSAGVFPHLGNRRLAEGTLRSGFPSVLLLHHSQEMIVNLGFTSLVQSGPSFWLGILFWH